MKKSLIAKFGQGATKSGATLKGIFEKALGGKSKEKRLTLVKKDILNRLKIKHPQINVDQIGKIYEKFIELISQLISRKRIEIRSLGIFYSKTIKKRKMQET